MPSAPSILEQFDQFLAERRLGRDGSATTAFVDAVQPLLMARLRKRLPERDPELWFDLAQKAWVRILAHPERIQATASAELCVYLHRVCDHLVFDLFRSQTRILTTGEAPTRIRFHSFDVDPDPMGPAAPARAFTANGPSPADQAANRVQLEQVRQAMARLAATSATLQRQMTAVWLARFRETSGAELAEALLGDLYRQATPVARKRLEDRTRQDVCRGQRAIRQALARAAVAGRDIPR